MIILLLVAMFGFLILALPMFLGMIVGPFAVMMKYYPNFELTNIVSQFTAGVNSFVLLAVPMFIYAAEIMSAGQTAQRLLNFVGSLVGHVRGGMAITTAGTCTIFGAISGSTQATLVAIGRPMRRQLEGLNYSTSHSIGLLMSAANIALLIPPSIAMIMYSVLTGVSVAEMFIAGIGPGLVLFALFAIYEFFIAGVKGITPTEKMTWGERGKKFKEAAIPLGFPVLILGGIYTGIFSPTEAAAVSVIYAVVVEKFIYKTVSWKDLVDIAFSTGVVTGTVFILLSAGAAFSWVITFASIPQTMIKALLGTDPSAIVVLLTVSGFFFLACMFVDSIPVILILTPIFFPVALEAGVDPIHLGMIVTLQAAVGAVTPPFGCNIFTASAIFDQSFKTVVQGLLPYLIIFVFASLLMIFVPEIALFFRNLAF
ncbi:MAG: TRAP transporter large permease [Clostridia bacterium]|nr:TRAP transporter large permease [Clostridia bacterium]